MNERILKTLEFEQVKTMIQQHLTTEQGGRRDPPIDTF